MSIIITGGAGFIGTNLLKRFIKSNKKIFILDNFSNSNKKFLEPFQKNKNLNIEDCNLADEFKTEEVFNSIRKTIKSPLEIWHFAANSNIQEGLKNAKIDLHNTFMTTFNVLEACKKYDIKSFYFASSSAVYGDHGNLLINESTGPLIPISNYGAMKLASEGYCLSCFESFLDKLRIFRFPNVVGSPATHGVIFDFINKLKKEPNNLKVLGDGNQSKSYLHVSDLIDAMIHISADRFNNIENPIYNLGQKDNPVSVKWIAEETIKNISPQASIIYGNEDRGWIGDVPKFNYDISKAYKTGWRPKLNSKNAIKQAIHEIKAQINQYG
tara:strand:+ start:290 stop:1267 length:978 start_codon:yes stop_codon:yes gene_type:complete